MVWGLAPAGKGDTTGVGGGGTPPRLILRATRSPNSAHVTHSSKQSQALSGECFLLVTAPGPPDSLEGDPVTDGARHHTALPSMLHTAGQSCEERPWPGRSQGNHTCLAPACSAMSPQHPEQLGPPPSTCCRGWTMLLFYQWCRGASRVGWRRVVGHGSEWPCKDRSL